MQSVFVKPVFVDGSPLLVRVPGTWQPLPREGAHVPLDEYWARRIRDGDVREAEPPADPEPETSSEPASGPSGTRKRA